VGSDSGCGCRVPASSKSHLTWLLSCGLGLLVLARRRRPTMCKGKLERPEP
jgi:hypothetical protein